MAAIARDVRELKRKDEELRRMAFFVESVQDYAIYFLDPLGRIQSWNEGAEHVKGYKAEEILGRSFSIFYTPEELQFGKPDQLMERAAQDGRAEDEGWRVRGDGSRFWAESTLTALRNDQGELQGFVKITRDVTQRRRIEELMRSNQELEQFAYVASHDLQEPLRMVASYVQLLARKYEDRLDADAKTYIEQAVDGAKRMQALINDLLAYSRVGNQPRVFEKVDFEMVLQDALRNLESTVRENKAQVTYDHLPVLVGDHHQFLQLLQNLLSNAMKFKGVEPPKIHVSAVEKDHEWLFSVKDNGIGVDPQYVEKIFEVFKRLHTRYEYPGTGIGLAICRKVVNRHGGRIWMESKGGEGATVHWTLPVMKGAALGTSNVG
jgi:PAS domain S-box-containing protein